MICRQRVNLRCVFTPVRNCAWVSLYFDSATIARTLSKTISALKAENRFILRNRSLGSSGIPGPGKQLAGLRVIPFYSIRQLAQIFKFTEDMARVFLIYELAGAYGF